MRHRRKISPEKVLEAIKKYFNDEGSKKAIADEYGISSSFFRACITGFFLLVSVKQARTEKIILEIIILESII